jgi:hypothetical protein
MTHPESGQNSAEQPQPTAPAQQAPPAPGEPPTPGDPLTPDAPPPPGPPPRSRTTRNLIITGVAALAVGGGVAGIMAATSGRDSARPSTADAEVVVNRYLTDINKGDKSDAETLICSRFRSDWRRNLQAPASDFDFKIDAKTVTYVGPGQFPKSTMLTYVLQVEDHGQRRESRVLFTITDESGPKICAES